jgi:D-threo-aldose 1-dehydrogenase
MIFGNPGHRLGFGASALGGLYDDVPEDAALATVAAAWQMGIRHFDTAPLYGSGLAELRVGDALAGLPRHAYTVSTKVGIRLVPGRPNPLYGAPPLGPAFDFSPEAIRRSHAESLERLGLDHIDVLLLHDPDDHVEEARRALDTMRELAPTVGVGTNSVETAAAFVEPGDVDVVLLAGRHTLLERAAGESLLPLCLERGVPVVAGSVFNSGLLAGGSTFHYTAAPPEIVARRDELADICARHGVPLAAAALQFPLMHEAVTGVVVGARSAAEIEEDVRLFDLPIPDALWEELELAAGAPSRRSVL